MFDRNARAGGRTTTVNAWGDVLVPVELGASIFVEVNYIVAGAAARFNLAVADAGSDQPPPEEATDLGVWNGDEFVLTTRRGDSWWHKAKLLWRYGLAPVRTNALMKRIVGRFLKAYEAPHFPFASLSDLAFDLDLTEITAATGQELLKKNSIGDKFANEVIQAR